MTDRRVPAPPDGPLTGLGLAALGAVLVVAGVLWSAVQIAARTTTGAWLPLPAGSFGAVLVGLVADPRHPAAVLAHHLPPGTPIPTDQAILVATILVISAAASLIACGLVMRGRLSGPGRRDRAVVEDARLARSRADLGDLVHRQSRPDPGGQAARIVLGTLGRHRVAVPARHSLLVLGPTQSGKTSRLAIPNLRAWPGPVVATSVKTDLVADTVTARRERGPVWIYDPTDATARTFGPRAGYDPLDAADTWAGALILADTLAGAAATTSTLQAGDFWAATAAKLLAPLLHAAALSAASIRDVVRWLDTTDLDEPRQRLEHNGATDEAIDALDATRNREDRTRSSAFATAETLLRCFADPTVAATAVPDYTPAALFDTGGTLYLIAPAHDQQRLRPLFTLLVTATLAEAHRRASLRPLNPPLLVLLDEAANIAPLANLDELAATGAGNGIQLLTVFQDLAQIRARYGHRADTIVNNHRTKLILGGNTDHATLDYASSLAGSIKTTRTSTSRSRNGTTTTDAPEARPLLSADALRRLPRGTGIVIHGDRRPVRLQLRR